MKKGKSNVTNFKKVTPLEMSKISGGKYITIILDGKEITVWIDD